MDSLSGRPLEALQVSDLPNISKTKEGRDRLRELILDPEGRVLELRTPLQHAVRLRHLFDGAPLLLNGRKVIYGRGRDGLDYYFDSDKDRNRRVSFSQGDIVREALSEPHPLEREVEVLRDRLAQQMGAFHRAYAQHAVEVEHMRQRYFLGNVFALGAVSSAAIFATGVLLYAIHVREKLENLLRPNVTTSSGDLSNDHPGVSQLYVPPVDELIVPTDISDSGLIFLASSPTSYTHRMDTLISNREVSRLLFDGKILGLGLSKGKDMRGIEQRLYRFTLPSKSNGETLVGQKEDAMNSMGWGQVLNALMDTPHLTDDELKVYVVWFYEKTFLTSDRKVVKLDFKHIHINRTPHGEVLSIRYTGESGAIIFNELLVDDRVPDTSAESNRDYKEVARPMTSKDGRLLLWLGVGQDLLVPETLLKKTEDFPIHFDLKIDKQVRGYQWTAEPLAYSMRHYFDTRNKGEFVKFNQNGVKPTYVMGWAHFVTPDDQMARWIVSHVVEPDMDACEKANALRAFWQDNTDYIVERGVEVNRPMMISLLRGDPALGTVGGGDCNNLSVGAATLYAAAGLDVALAYADTDPAKVKGKPVVYGSHLLTALSVTELGPSCAVGPAIYTVTDGKGNKKQWVLSEPQGRALFGEFSLGSELEVRGIVPYDPTTDNLRNP